MGQGGYPDPPPGGYPDPPGGVPGQVPPRGDTRSGTPPGVPGPPPPGGVPGPPTGGYPDPPRGYPVRYPPRGGTQVGQQKEYSLHGGGGYPGRTTEGVLTTRRAVCLLRSRRRTFLFGNCYNFKFLNRTIGEHTFCQQKYHQKMRILPRKESSLT